MHPFLQSGDPAPAFRLQDDQERWVSLEHFASDWLVLYFYPKDFTSGCTKQACDFGEQWDLFQKEGAQVVGVSKDLPESHARFKGRWNLPFCLLADPEGKMLEAYGVWKEKSMYGKKYWGIERSTFLINPQGLLVKIYPKVQVTEHVATVLADLKEAQSQRLKQ